MKLNRVADFFLAVCFLVFFAHLWLEKERINKQSFQQLGAKIDSLEVAVDTLRQGAYELRRQVEAMNYIDLPEELYFCGQRVPLEKPFVRRKLEDEIFSLTKFKANRWRVDLYLREAQFYFPYFEEGLAQDSLPLDLKYIAVIESELNNEARSPMNAVGIWQLIPGTAVKWALEVGYYIDDRRDFAESFRGARAEFKELHQRFNDWLMVAAAYNAGKRRLEEAIADNQEQRERLWQEKQVILDSTYFDLQLPAETTEYGPRFLAMKIVMENYKLYGFRDPPYSPADVEEVTYVVSEKKRILEVAADLGMSVPDFRSLNARFVKSEIPPGFYKMRKLKKKQ